MLNQFDSNFNVNIQGQTFYVHVEVNQEQRHQETSTEIVSLQVEDEFGNEVTDSDVLDLVEEMCYNREYEVA